MPTTEKLLRVFVSSPGDVAIEREVLVAAITELNNTWAAHLGLRLEPVLWETHCRPAAGADLQQVINQQLPKDCDIFVGIMWKRFGSATPRFGSGTEEEFEAAYSRHKRFPHTVSVLFYFKDEPVSPSELDASQLKNLHGFKKKLGPKGVLYWHFKSTDEFRQLLRMHLSREMQQWSDRVKKKNGERNGHPTRQPAAKGSRQTAAVNLAELRKQFKQKERKLNQAVEQYLGILEDSVAELARVSETSKDKRKLWADASIKALNTFYSKAKPYALTVPDLVEDLTEAWVNELIAHLLVNTITASRARQTVHDLKDLSQFFSRLSSFYHRNFQPSSYCLKTPGMQSTERKMTKLYEFIASKQEAAARLLQEAVHIVETLVAKRAHVQKRNRKADKHTEP